MPFLRFLAGCVRLVTRGGRVYWSLVAVLHVLVAIGLVAFRHQVRVGLVATNMRDQVSWAFYVGNFTFLVGVAAAAVLLVIPAYVYHWKPIKEVVVLGELLAVSALTMCLLFIVADMGKPGRFTHIVPLLGKPNWPRSMLTWDAMVLNVYLVVNLAVVVHTLYRAYHGRDYDKRFVVPMVLFSIPMAVAIHTVTAFLYSGMVARPYWNEAILAPRFLASAFSSGPAVMLILFQVLRKTADFPIKDEAIWKVAELMAYAMFVNLFLQGAEIFKAYYSDSEHLLFTQYVWSGIGEHRALVPFAWVGLACSVVAFLILLVPRTRKRFWTLNVGCVLVWIGVYVEKGMGLVIAGLTPDALGEIYEYTPSLTELAVAAGVFAAGSLVFLAFVKIAIPILYGAFRAGGVVAPGGGAVPAGEAAAPEK
ncbi:MAG TPA: NrfD/PsrC family molybdoenzyme membrane anchor subunit [Anaeromyxobacteraceae bacterium]|nr:NrfD/PsrC family molybdoenzyme membrane anchor subunit [Anaeromyxobacteraceae bacterium]